MNQMYQQMVEEDFSKQKGDSSKPQEVQAGMFGGQAAADFPMDQIPPDFELAKLHREAWKVGRNLTSQKRVRRSATKVEDPDNPDALIGKICQCCTRQVPSDRMNIGCNNMDYSFLGTGVPLYFEFIKTCILMLLVMFVTSGDYNIITNWVYGIDCHPLEDPTQNDDPNFCALTWVTESSLANKRSIISYIELQQMLNLVSMITLIVVFQMFRKSQREIDVECDQKTSYASDYTIHVKNIPLNLKNLKNNDQDEDLFDYFAKYLDTIPVDPEITDIEEQRHFSMKALKVPYHPMHRVVCVNLVYRLEEQMEKENLKQAKIAEKQKILSELYGQGIAPEDPQILQNERIVKVQKEIDEYEAQLEALEDKLHKGQDVADYFLGQAFVTFQWETDVQEILKRNHLTFFDKLLGRKSELVYNDVHLLIQPPPEPTDVYWENLHVPTKAKIWRRAVGYILTLTVLTVCAVMIYYLTEVQANAADEQAKALKAGDTNPKTGVKILAFVASILITVINGVLAIIITKVSEFERFSTQTGYNISLASKSSIAQFANTALITFLISIYITKNIYGSGGLIYNQTYVFITNAIIPGIMQLIDIPTVTKWIFIKLEERKGKKSVKTQKQLHELYEKPIFNIANQYAIVLKNMYVVVFYASIIPLGLIISCIGLLTHYWVEKYNIGRRRAIKFNYSSEMSIEMTEQLEFILPIYCLTNLFWEYKFSDGDDISTFALIGVALGVLNAILPMQNINEILFPMTVQIEQHLPIQIAEESFLTDYPRENPATSERARQDYNTRIEKHRQQRAKLENIPLKSAKALPDK